jgi:cytochrome c553
LIRPLTALAACAALVLVASSSGAEDKTPPIKEIMNKAHKGGDSLLATVGKDLKADKPDWDDVQKLSKQLVELGTALGKNKPPKGDQDSWDKLTKEYVETANTLVAAADKKEKKDAAAAQAKLAGSCMACHKAHK